MRICADGCHSKDDDQHVQKKQRGDALDDIEQILTLSVEVGGERKEVRVLPTASNAHNLSVELKPEALTLLLSMPDGEDAAPFMPEIPCECPNVGWRGGIEATLVTRFWAEGKWRYSHKSVPRGDAERAGAVRHGAPGHGQARLRSVEAPLCVGPPVPAPPVSPSAPPRWARAAGARA